MIPGRWRPTHRLYDREGRDVGEYEAVGLGYRDELTWLYGPERVSLTVRQMDDLGWRAVPLDDVPRRRRL